MINLMTIKSSANVFVTICVAKNILQMLNTQSTLAQRRQFKNKFHLHKHTHSAQCSLHVQCKRHKTFHFYFFQCNWIRSLASERTRDETFWSGFGGTKWWINETLHPFTYTTMNIRILCARMTSNTHTHIHTHIHAPINDSENIRMDGLLDLTIHGRKRTTNTSANAIHYTITRRVVL